MQDGVKPQISNTPQDYQRVPATTALCVLPPKKENKQTSTRAWQWARRGRLSDAPACARPGISRNGPSFWVPSSLFRKVWSGTLRGVLEAQPGKGTEAAWQSAVLSLTRPAPLVRTGAPVRCDAPSAAAGNSLVTPLGSFPSALGPHRQV